MPGPTDFRVGLKIVVELGPAAPEKVGSAGQVGQGGAAFEPVGGNTLAERRVVALLMGELDPALDARKQAAKGPGAAFSEAFVAAVHPYSPGGEPPPRVDSGAPDHLPGAGTEAVGPGLGPGYEQADAGVGKLVVAHLQRDAPVAIGAAFVAGPYGEFAAGGWQGAIVAAQLGALDPLPALLAAREFHFSAMDGNDRNPERMVFIAGGRKPRALGDHAAEGGFVVDGREQFGEIGAIAADLDGERTLPRRGGVQRERQHHDFAGVERGTHACANIGEFRRGGFEQPVDVGLGHDQRRGFAVHELREARFGIATRQHEGDARWFDGQRPLQEAREIGAPARGRRQHAQLALSRPDSQLRFTSSRSRVSARGSVAAMCVSGLPANGRSFQRCTAMSMALARSATPRSPVKPPRRRSSASGVSSSRSPGEVRKEYSIFRPGWRASKASPTRRACTCASTLARAPNTMGLSRVISCMGEVAIPCQEWDGYRSRPVAADVAQCGAWVTHTSRGRCTQVQRSSLPARGCRTRA